jgi:hypothetical protein
MSISDLWNNFIKNTFDYVIQKNKNYEIHIYPSSVLKSSDFKPLLSYLKRLIDKDSEGLFCNPDGSTTIVMRKLPDDYSPSIEISRADGEACILKVETEDIELGFRSPVYIGVLDSS